MPATESRFQAILRTDIKGFTERTARDSREGLVTLLAEMETLLVPTVEDFGGRVVKTIGDAILAAFDSPTNAVLCGIRMQERMDRHNASRPEEHRVLVRIAVAAGEVELVKGDVFGEAVNLAARLEAVAEPTAVYLTECVYLAMKRSEVPLVEIGRRAFKGIPDPVGIFKVDRSAGDPRYAALAERLEAHRRPVARRPFATTARLLLPLLLACVAFFVVYFHGPNHLARQIDRKLAAGDLPGALLLAEVMVERFPDSSGILYLNRVVAAEVERAIAAGRLEQGLETLRRRADRHSTLHADPLERRLLVALYRRDAAAAAGGEAARPWAEALRRKFAGDPEVRALLSAAGADAPPPGR